MTTVGDVLAGALRARGIGAVYGAPTPGLTVVPVAGSATAGLFAEAHGRVRPTGAATVDDGVLSLTGASSPTAGTTPGTAPGATPPAAPVPVASEVELLDALGGGATQLRLDVDLGRPSDGAPVPAAPAVDRWVEPSDELVDRLLEAERPVLLVGPGLVRAGAVPGLHALAAVAHLGVLNTWGAKGVFDWRSRHHLATAGLQRDDYVLGGLADADLVVTCGLDPDEAPTDQWQLAPAVDVAPGALDPLSARWLRAATDIVVPPLRAGLADVTQRGWAVDAGPLPPSRVTRTYAQLFGTGGLLAADAGVAGFWVARTYATTELGAVQVPGRRRPGLAVACVAVARLADPHRRALAVVDALDEASEQALAAAGASGVAVPVEVWAEDGPSLEAEAHAARAEAAAGADRPAPLVIGTDRTQRAEIEAVAGPVVAWGGVR